MNSFLLKIVSAFKLSKKNSFRENYSRKYGTQNVSADGLGVSMTSDFVLSNKYIPMFLNFGLVTLLERKKSTHYYCFNLQLGMILILK